MRILFCITLILFQLPFWGCSNQHKDNLIVKKIRISEIGVINKPIHEIVFSLDSVNNHSNPWYFNFVLVDSIFGKVLKETIMLPNDTSKFINMPTYHGFVLDFYTRDNVKIEEKIAQDSLIFFYLGRISEIFQVNHVDSISIDKIEHVKRSIFKSI